MKAKTKTFDCVEMKRKSQEALLKEFEARRDEFASLCEFIEAKANESKWVTETWNKFGSGQSPPRRSKPAS